MHVCCCMYSCACGTTHTGGGGHTVEALARAWADLNIGDEVSCSSCSTAVECIAACHYQHCSGGLCPLFTVHTCTVLPPQNGYTALMVSGYSETVHVLVQLGADLNIQNKVCM